jgi:gluconate 2-dehydrogenase gamma chain
MFKGRSREWVRYAEKTIRGLSVFPFGGVKASVAGRRRAVRERYGMIIPAPTPLASAEARTLDALLDTLIPPDDEWPGAVEAGVPAFLLALLSTDLAPLAPEYRRGLAALDAEATAVQGSPFADLTPDARTALLQRLLQGEVAAAAAWESGDAAALDPALWLRRAAEHAAEGFYTSPVGLEMVGFTARMPQVLMTEEGVEA